MKVQTILLLGTSLLTGASVSAGPTHPLLKCKELYVVEIAALGPEVLHTFKDEKAWPRVEHRRTASLLVKGALMGGRNAGERFDYPVVEYRIDGGDRPTTPWDTATTTVGSRFLFAPGGEPRWNKEIKGILDTPLILRDLDFEERKGAGAQQFIEEAREILRIRSLPADEQFDALTKRLAGKGFASTARFAAEGLFLAHPDKAAAATSIGEFCLRPKISPEARRTWVSFLTSFRNHQTRADDRNGNLQVCSAYWRLLDRGEPPRGEDPKLVRNVAINLVDALYPGGKFGLDGKWAEGWFPDRFGLDPNKSIPAECSNEKILSALQWAKKNDSTRYNQHGKIYRYDRRLDVLIAYVRRRH